MADSFESCVGMLEARVRTGDREALAELLQEHTESLRRWIERRLDHRFQKHITASDVLQEVYLAAEQRLEHYAKLDDMPFGVWIRLLAGQKLIEFHRRYCETEARDLDREVPMDAGSGSGTLAARLPGDFTTPSQAAMRHERARLLDSALDALEPADREVIRLRHFEALSNEEVALRLGIHAGAATKRYARALARLKSALERVPEFREAMR